MTDVPALASPRLAVLKALGDNTRYAIYLEMARSPRPLTTAEIADTLQLHPNTVRPHLERMREVGLLEVDAHARGTPGRPQHRYSLAPDAPSLGLEPPTFPILARMLLRLAGQAELGAAEAVESGREQGRSDAEVLPVRNAPADRSDTNGETATSAGGDIESKIAPLVGRLDELGFDPAVVVEEGEATVAFLHCPFLELAEQHTELVCGMHRGLIEGFVNGRSGCRVTEFHPLADRTPCQMTLVTDAAIADESLS